MLFLQCYNSIILTLVFLNLSKVLYFVLINLCCQLQETYTHLPVKWRVKGKRVSRFGKFLTPSITFSVGKSGYLKNVSHKITKKNTLLHHKISNHMQNKVDQFFLVESHVH